MAARNYRQDPRRTRLEQLAKIETIKPIPAPGQAFITKNEELKNPIISSAEPVEIKPTVTVENKEAKKKNFN
jgi:hypothetical protein